mmetsp:Transcript_132426/g.313944  ORF Transcript_132426/g.313944 Transcript_132426/m.313944 type:complete len:206 (+) Transcript_132426:908-1525(+)
MDLSTSDFTHSSRFSCTERSANDLSASTEARKPVTSTWRCARSSANCSRITSSCSDMLTPTSTRLFKCCVSFCSVSERKRCSAATCSSTLEMRANSKSASAAGMCGEVRIKPASSGVELRKADPLFKAPPRATLVNKFGAPIFGILALFLTSSLALRASGFTIDRLSASMASTIRSPRQLMKLFMVTVPLLAASMERKMVLASSA